MTKDEAISLLYRLKFFFDHTRKRSRYSEQLAKALDMAIEALQREARPIDDLVSRDAVVDTILETYTRLKGHPTANHLIENIDALPSADKPQGEDWDKYSEKLWRLAYERGLNARPKGEPEPVVAYICDRRRCAICSGPDGGCDHTTDIKHAAHFKNVAGQYFERPYMEEDDG